MGGKTSRMTIEDEFVDVIDIPKSRPYNPELIERCVKMNKKGSKSDISGDYEELILEVLQKNSPCMAKSFYKKIDITEGQLYYRLKKLQEQGLIEHKNNNYFLVQEEKSDQKNSPGPIIMCKNQSICKYFDSNTCYPEICKYFKKDKE